MVYEVGRLDAPGRPALFGTTEEFLRRFGIGSTTDLPDLNPEQEEEIKTEVEEELQMKLGIVLDELGEELEGEENQGMEEQLTETQTGKAGQTESDPLTSQQTEE